MFSKIGSFFLDILQTIVLALSLFVISYLFLFQPHQVRGSSMAQNFTNDDFLLTDKISYRFQSPGRGDVIVFRAPPSEPCSEEECEYIKRIVGLPGDTIEIKDEAYYVNGKKLLEPYLKPGTETRPGLYLTEGKVLKLDEGEYFASGDNRTQSHDSRSFGPIKREAIIGKAWLRYWPTSKFGFVASAKARS